MDSHKIMTLRVIVCVFVRLVLFAKALKAVQLCFGSMLLTGDFI